MSKSEEPKLAELKKKVSVLPDKPGVYQFFDENHKVIYIGKAKSLRKRVASYFNKVEHNNAKLKLMVRKINDIKFIIVETEFDALLLENTLIKKWQPRYNVMLKDDKTFPWICIKKEAFPRVFSTRKIIKDGSDYYGPYASVRTMNVLLDLVHRLYKLRNCNYSLKPENIAAKKFKVCLEYHIGNCNGPCEGLEEESAYMETIKSVRHLIKGNLSTVVHEMKQLMANYAADMAFEKAQAVKEKLDLILNYQQKSTVVSATINNVDVFSIFSDDDIAYVNYFKVANGAVIQSHTLEIKKKLNESDALLLSYAITDIRLRLNSTSKEIIVSIKPDTLLPEVKYTLPQKGDKKHLLELSERNVKYYLLEYRKQKAQKLPVSTGERIMKTLMADLRMTVMPEQIECFDISNMQGGDAVAAMVVFKNARPAKKDYRVFNIKTVAGPDDYASLEEVVYRRYKRLTEEKLPLPQLIIIDGGKGQLSAAVKSLKKLDLQEKISVIGIAKRLEEIFFPEDSIPLYLDKRSEALRLIQFMRNEAHRFGIKHHRKKTLKRIVKSEVYDIKGIGEKTATLLLQKFSSVKKIKEASLKELQQTIGKAKGLMVFNFFNI